MEEKKTYILGIESSCDDTSAAVLCDGVLLSNVTASQDVHRDYGGVVPELASRAHQQNVLPVVDQAIKRAGIDKEQLSAVAFTRGPGLMGSLLVGVNFAKGFARALGIPLIDVNHLQGHVMAHFIKEDDNDHSAPPTPFLCLLVSGGNSQIVKVDAYDRMEVLGQTIDDAAGEAIDKCSKVMGLGYPGGPIIDRLARQGNPHAYQFSEPHIPGLDYSFSGLKTSFLYHLREWVAEDPDFVEHHKEDLAASLEYTIVDILMKKLRLAVKQTGIKHVALAGGVSANNGLRNAFRQHAKKYGWTIYIPKFSYTTDNAAMIAITGYYKYKDKQFCGGVTELGDVDGPTIALGMLMEGISQTIVGRDAPCQCHMLDTCLLDSQTQLSHEDIDDREFKACRQVFLMVLDEVGILFHPIAEIV